MHVRTLALLAAGIVLAATSTAVAGDVVPPPVAVPGPGTLTLLTVGAAAAAIGARWIRRR